MNQKQLKRLINRAAHHLAIQQEVPIQQNLTAKCIALLKEGKTRMEVAEAMGLLPYMGSMERKANVP